MPQLDLFSYFSAATYLILSFLVLIFILHSYYLPKLAVVLKFRKKIQIKNIFPEKTNSLHTKAKEEEFLNLSHKYINEMEKISKIVSK